ncbi:MAG: hypothetical protein EA422_06825 [Gemmatimonadales bacterium]|nr:MAG: hypothetical protein EA422_06825 [Gemmatimonadales bacterium]
MDGDLLRWEVWPQASGERAAGPGRILFRNVDAPFARSLEAEVSSEDLERWGSPGGIVNHAPADHLISILERAQALP